MDDEARPFMDDEARPFMDDKTASISGGGGRVSGAPELEEVVGGGDQLPFLTMESVAGCTHQFAHQPTSIPSSGAVQRRGDVRWSARRRHRFPNRIIGALLVEKMDVTALKGSRSWSAGCGLPAR